MAAQHTRDRHALVQTFAYALALALISSAGLARAQPPSARLTLPSGFRDTAVVVGLHQPIAFAFVPGPANRPIRALVLEQKLRYMRLVVGGQFGAIDPLPQIADVDWEAGERGLLSLAIDPRWPAKPYVYMHYTSTSRAIHLARFRMSGDLAFSGNGALTMDPASRMLLLADIPDSNTNHNGGALRFAPDSMLLFSTGDDQLSCPAQDLSSLAGKLLRLDVRSLPDTGPGPVPRALITPADNPWAASPDSNRRLLWAIGLRNPFRFHIDPANGAVFVADVGQSNWEEIDRVTGVSNLGWPWFEGPQSYATCPGPVPAALDAPIFNEPHPGSVAILTLGVYRAPPGASEPWPTGYEGDLLYADYYFSWVRRIGFNGMSWVRRSAPGQPGPEDWAAGDGLQIVDGAVGPDGALWYLSASVGYTFNTGSLHRIRFVGPVDSTLSVGPAPEPSALALASANPARGRVRIAYTLRTAADIELSLHDLSGRRVRRLVSGTRASGTHVAEWDGQDLRGDRMPPGVYFARLTSNGVPATLRIAWTP